MEAMKICAVRGLMLILLGVVGMPTDASVQTLTTLYSGNLYGTTYTGGPIGGSGCPWCGTVFALTPTGTLRVLHSFNSSDGSSPQGGLIADAEGDLYGTTSLGGSSNAGTVFKQTVSAPFDGVPGTANCTGQSISFLTTEFGGIAHAATALGFGSVTDLHDAVAAHCAGH